VTGTLELRRVVEGLLALCIVEDPVAGVGAARSWTTGRCSTNVNAKCASEQDSRVSLTGCSAGHHPVPSFVTGTGIDVVEDKRTASANRH
jgi:hypothetical protein